jgi:hypothetical protein
MTNFIVQCPDVVNKPIFNVLFFSFFQDVSRRQISVGLTLSSVADLIKLFSRHLSTIS